MSSCSIDILSELSMDVATEYAAAVAHEMKLEDERIGVKMAAIDRIMKSGDNALTGKPHSFSSAESVVNTDKEYAEYLSKQRDATMQKILLKTKMEVALCKLNVATTAI